ncbi:MAG: DNA topoisomerase IB [Gammaproteobacteria bacterium]
MSRRATPFDVDTRKAVARRAHLRYVQPSGPGYVRIRRGRSFAYRDAAGRPASQSAAERIRALVLPPAWTDIWICRHPRGHLQATGRDARGRTQYRYHADWTRAVAELKFERMAIFARNLPAIRRRVRRDLSRPGLPREKVLAAVVRLLEQTLIRVGNEEYARENGSFGLTTIRKRHVESTGGSFRLSFQGKSRVRHAVEIRPGPLADVIRECLQVPGRDLFQYVDATGAVRDVKAGEVNAYLAEIGGENCTAKDFRTWGATVLMYRELLRGEPASSMADIKRTVRTALAAVAEALRNTVAVCRKSYVHPRVIDAYVIGQRAVRLASRLRRRAAFGQGALSVLEVRTLRLLEGRA